jgi:hypothetical protein
VNADTRRSFAQRRAAQLKVFKQDANEPTRAAVPTSLAARRAEKEQEQGATRTAGEFVGSTRVSDFYTAQVTVTVTLTRAEADALRNFLTRTPPRATDLGCALGCISDALADKGI